MSVIRIAIADDHSLFRTGIKVALQTRRDIVIVAEAENGLQLLNLLRHIQPDIILLDIQMPVMDGLTALQEIKKLYPETKVIMLSFLNDDKVISKMMDLGASSYITKESGADKIYETICLVHKNGFYFDETVTNALQDKGGTSTEMLESIKMTGKELEVLKFLVEEKSIKEIADLVDLSPRTVEAVIDNLKTKVGVKSTAELVVYALKNDIGDNRIEEVVLLFSKEQIMSLFKISTSIISYINHDLAGQRAVIFNSLDQLKDILSDSQNKANVAERISNLLKDALDATKSISAINNLIKSYSSLTRSKTQDELLKMFISAPRKLIEFIQQRNKELEIEIIASDTTLKIVYPYPVLLSILSEFVENAKKNADKKLRILIKWNIKDNVFHCEIHDNGPGFIGLAKNKLYPMAFLKLEHPGMGLKIIERTIIDSEGHLFFSKSEILEGAKVYFDFPVIDFTTRNT